MDKRSATHWHMTVDGRGRSIRYIVSDEVGVPSVALCSVQDPASGEPSRRMVGDGWEIAEPLDPEADAPYPERGLVLYGRTKHDRPDLADALCIDPEAAEAMAASISSPTVAVKAAGRALWGEHGWQRAMSEALGVAKDTVQDWRQGRYAPHPNKLERLAQMAVARRRELRAVEAMLRAAAAARTSRGPS